MEPTADTAAAVAAEIGDDRIRSLFVAVDELVAAALARRATDVWRGTMSRGHTARWFLVGVAAQSAYVSVNVNAATLGPAAITIRDLDQLDLEAFDDLPADQDQLTGPDAW